MDSCTRLACGFFIHEVASLSMYNAFINFSITCTRLCVYICVLICFFVVFLDMTGMPESPVRRFRQPRFSETSPNENNCPSFSDNGESFARQLASSPTKFSERSVLFLLGNKVPSSVPGRRSSIACSREGRSMAPSIVLTEESEDEHTVSVLIRDDSRGRSQSLKTMRTSYRSLSSSKMSFRSLKRL